MLEGVCVQCTSCDINDLSHPRARRENLTIECRKDENRENMKLTVQHANIVLKHNTKKDSNNK